MSLQINEISTKQTEIIGVLTITSEHPPSEDCLETNIQSKFDKSDQNFEQPEEELMNFIEQQNQ